MNKEPEKASQWLFRHFGDTRFKPGEMKFRYGRDNLDKVVVYEIKTINSIGLTYGSYMSRIYCTDPFYMKNFSVKRTLFGLRMVFDLIDG